MFCSRPMITTMAPLRSLASMWVVVDEFFKQVMVVAEDPVIRTNRMSLLDCISQLFRSIADISRIVTVCA